MTPFNSLIRAVPTVAFGVLLAVSPWVAPPRAHAATLVIPQDAARSTQRVAFDRAVDDFRRGRFAAAYGQFVRLADQGDTRAAAIALVMHREGRALFRTDWDASTDQLSDWRALSVDALHREAVQP